MGFTESQISQQLKMFAKGSSYCKLLRPAKINDGIEQFSKREINHYIATWENSLNTKQIIKFVPASGAATRMFESLISLYSTPGEIGKKDLKKKNQEVLFFLRFIQGLKKRKFAFYNDLKLSLAKDEKSLEDFIKKNKFKKILEYFLTQKGLNYAATPKALLKFHQYGAESRSALEEHLIEGKEYARNREGIVRIHFTLSGEFEAVVKDYLYHILDQYEKEDTRYDITFSIQKTSTQTLAVDRKNKPLRDRRGNLIFRPGGHGALIENLNELKEDIIFIKNIDNVVPDRLKKETVIYKKALAGYLIELQNQIFQYLKQLAAKKISATLLKEIIQFCQTNLYFIFPPGFAAWNKAEKAKHLFEKLNRPIRICGMVKNLGEPGGGPFWIQDQSNQISMQIIEKSQIDKKSAEQVRMLSEASHFNPVDLVCGVRNFQGNKFDLQKYIDPDTYFISGKSLEGKPIKALELPGLWNGAMARWISLFVEIPIITFNPVKTINDLLRSEHQ
jgi:hypothetical protein